MSYVKIIFLAVLGIVLVTLCLANTAMVELKVLPRGLTGLFGFQERVHLPLFAVILLSIALGILIGFVWEWLREWRIRRTAERREREVRALEQENRKLRVEVGEEDDVIALIESRPPAPARAAT